MKKLLVLAVLFWCSVTSASAATWPAFASLTSADVRCETPDEWAIDTYAAPYSRAYVLWNGDSPLYAVFSPEACGGLLLFLSDPNDKYVKGFAQRKGEALLTYLHETGHLRGERDEAKVECAALRSVRAFARTHGADRKHVELLYSYARASHLRTPAEYQTVC